MNELPHTKIKLVSTTDAANFQHDLQVVLDDFDSKGYRTEVQYAVSGVHRGAESYSTTQHSALVVARRF